MEKTNIAGPGERFSLWVQGCKRHCRGCLAAETWDPDGGELLDCDEIVRRILNTKNIEGITFLGGEPFEQAEALSVIAGAVKENGLSVVVFTGYTIGELNESGRADFRELLSLTDLLIDGAFVLEKRSFNRPWVGSENQNYIFLTDFYSIDEIRSAGNRIEVRIYPNGKAIASGMGDFSKIRI